MFTELFRRYKKPNLPFVIEPTTKSETKKALMHDARYIYSTKQPLSDEIIQHVLSGFNQNNILSRNIHNWMVWNKEKVEIVNYGIVRYDESKNIMSPEYYRSASFDTHTGLASLGFFIQYSEMEHKFRVQINNPDPVNAKCYPNIDIREFCDTSQTSKLLGAAASACEFIPLIVCRNEDAVHINSLTSPIKASTSGSNILKSIYIMKHLLKTNYFNSNIIDPKKDYLVFEHRNNIWIEPADNQKGE